MELIKTYNEENFPGFPEYIDDFYPELENIPDLKF